jgi:regulator of sigma D
VKCADDASVCPDEKYLKAPKQLSITAEGVEGSFHLEVQSITAVNTASMHAILV